MELEELLVPDVKALRHWLARHHSSSGGVWLVLHKKGGGVTELTYAQARDEALCFGWIDGQIAKRDEGSYRQRFTPRRPRSAWSASNVARVNELTRAGRMEPAGLAAVAAAKAQGRWEASYPGQATAQVPDDLARALEGSPRAARNFEKLGAANRFSIIYRLQAVKRATTRERKVVQFVEMLERGESLHPQRTKKNG